MATETINWEAYEYGLKGVDGEIIQIGQPEALCRNKRPGEKIMMRAVYVTSWIPFIGRAE